MQSGVFLKKVWGSGVVDMTSVGQAEIIRELVRMFSSGDRFLNVNGS